MGNNTSLSTLYKRKVLKGVKEDSRWPLPHEYMGIEIEVEDCDDLPDEDNLLWQYWNVVSDGSLRNGREFVFSGPHAGVSLYEAIRSFFAAKLQYNHSPRTSTHIHINASDGMTVENLRVLIAMMYLIEPAVFRWADEDRKWCSYCQPLTDMGPERFATIITEDSDIAQLTAAISPSNHHDRYYGLNIKSFGKHGTVEYRYFPCATSEETLTQWVRFVMMTKKAACAFSSVDEFLSTVSTPRGFEAFMGQAFAEIADILMPLLDRDDVIRRTSELIGVSVMNRGNSRVYRGSQRHVPSRGLRKFIAKKHPHLIPLFQDQAAQAPRAASDVWAEILNGSTYPTGQTGEFDSASASMERLRQRLAQEAAELSRASPTRTARVTTSPATRTYTTFSPDTFVDDVWVTGDSPSIRRNP